MNEHHTHTHYHSCSCGCDGHHDHGCGCGDHHHHHHHEEENVMPVFLCTGLSGSGKTTLIKDTVMTQEWMEDGKTLLILCEEGEVTYSDEYLKEKNIAVVRPLSMDEMTAEFFDNLVEEYKPSQVVIECNGLWDLSQFMMLMYPEDWDLQGVYSTVDGKDFAERNAEEKEAVFANLTDSDLVIVNRCPEGFDRREMRRALRMVNPGADMIFEDMEGNVIEPDEEDLPYDVTSETVVIADEDFGVFYLDTFDNPKVYEGKKVQVKVQTLNPVDGYENMFIAARKMTTGETEFYGYPCKYQGEAEFAEEAWKTVTAEIKYEYLEDDDEKQPVMYLLEMQDAQPCEDIIVLG
ncbi:MAG: GTP-binding protein [Eubacterium sp.]|nr:GTP-binding protein [Eubacterium sp.]